jgi:hypothetical protein
VAVEYTNVKTFTQTTIPSSGYIENQMYYGVGGSLYSRPPTLLGKWGYPLGKKDRQECFRQG